MSSGFVFTHTYLPLFVFSTRGGAASVT